MKTNRYSNLKTASRLALVGLACFTMQSRGQDTNIDFQATQAAADKGDAKAQYELASDYAQGVGLAHDLPKGAQYAKAVEYLRKAADQGYAPAEVNLGSLYGRGRWVPRNLPTAVQWGTFTPKGVA